MLFTAAQLVDIRRFCGYPAFGNNGTAFEGWRFFASYGVLEYKMQNLSTAEGAIVVTYLATLNTLEAAIPGTGANLDTESAAVWTHNKYEQRDREALFASWRMKLCGFLGVPPGPELGPAGMRIVV